MITFKDFGSRDVKTVNRRVTYPTWADLTTDSDVLDESILYGFYKKSADTASFDYNYFLNVYANDPDTDSSNQPQFSVAFGSRYKTYITSSTTTNEGLKYTCAPTAVYNQLTSICGLPSFTGLNGGVPYTMNNIYVISIGRDRVKDRIDAGNIKFKLSSSANYCTYSDLIASTNTVDKEFGYIYKEAGNVNAVIPTGSANTIGIIYYNRGYIILDANKISTDLSGSTDLSDIPTNSGSYINSSNYVNFIYTIVSGGGYFKSRSSEYVTSTYYYVNIKNDEYNDSDNKTRYEYNDASGAYVLNQSLSTNNRTYISSVGLYDNAGDMIAHAKLSKPIVKTSETEANIQVRIDF